MHHCAMYFEANDWAEVLHSMDADGNGKIDFTEFIAAAYNKQKLLNEDNLHTAFKIFDVDGDGQISKEELKSVFKGNSLAKVVEKFEHLWDEICSQVDTDGNHEISFVEFSKAMHMVIENRAAILGQKKSE